MFWDFLTFQSGFSLVLDQKFLYIWSSIFFTFRQDFVYFFTGIFFTCGIVFCLFFDQDFVQFWVKMFSLILYQNFLNFLIRIFLTFNHNLLYFQIKIFLTVGSDYFFTFGSVFSFSKAMASKRKLKKPPPLLQCSNLWTKH